MSVPATPGLSAYLTSVVHNAFARPQVTANHHRFGSMLSIAPEAIAPVRVPVATPAFGAPEPLPPLAVLLVLLAPPQAASSSDATAASAAQRTPIFFVPIT